MKKAWTAMSFQVGWLGAPMQVRHKGGPQLAVRTSTLGVALQFPSRGNIGWDFKVHYLV